MITENKDPKGAFVHHILTPLMLFATLCMFTFCSKNEKHEETVAQPSARSTPLYLLDCKRITEAVFKSIDPEDIESITILKGAQAIQRFGANAAGGVIVIRTKNATQPPCVTF
jgi:TonB-dependent SusC/RagA subfamily outer membrane receptor